MASQKVYGVSETQVAKAPAYFDAVKGQWVISYAAWDGARILDPTAERPVVAGLRNGLYIVDYVRSQGDQSSTVDEVCIFVYNSPLANDPTIRRFAPGRDYSMPQPVKEWPPRKQGEICHVMGIPPADLPVIYDIALPYRDWVLTEGNPAVIGQVWYGVVYDLIDRNRPTEPLVASPNAVTVITINVPSEYAMLEAPGGNAIDQQTCVTTIQPNYGNPQGYQSLNLTPQHAGPGVFNYTVTVGGVQTSAGTFTFPVSAAAPDILASVGSGGVYVGYTVSMGISITADNAVPLTVTLQVPPEYTVEGGGTSIVVNIPADDNGMNSWATPTLTAVLVGPGRFSYVVEGEGYTPTVGFVEFAVYPGST